ncbi:MAG: Fe(3+) dicitrate transport protein FecA precursor [Pseudomonadota bacterium]
MIMNKKLFPAFGAVFLSAGVCAQEATLIPEVVVSATRVEQDGFDAPAAVNAVQSLVLQTAGPQVNLTEALARLPGVMASNRNNYAQDPQISIRGFGARAAFGVRGIRLIADGIPASIPDGQGQASSFALGSADRIEVIRGPLAILYGNASGGVIQSFSRTPATGVSGTASAVWGSDGLMRQSLQLDQANDRSALLVDVSRFETDGHRDQSAAKREQLHAKFDLRISPATTWSVVLSDWDQPLAEDPAGLTPAAFEQNPQQAGANTVARRVRKITDQSQLGVRLRSELSKSAALEARVYAGTRSNLQYQAFNAWVGLERDFSGLGLQLSGLRLGSSVPGSFLLGLEHDRAVERRQGGPASLGEKAGINRDEDNAAIATGLYGSWEVPLAEQVTGLLGVRVGRLRLENSDFYLSNGNSSGEVQYRQTSPVVGLTWHASPKLNVFASVGRGFESPTLAEVAYASAPSGAIPTSDFNSALKAAVNRQFEVGMKWRPSPQERLDLVGFRAKTVDEVVTDQSAFGRTSFRNAPGTIREGLELAHAKDWGLGFRSSAALTWMRAVYSDSARSTLGLITSGSRIPSVPRHQAFAALEWASARDRSGQAMGWSAALEGQSFGSRVADDLNQVRVNGTPLMNAWVGYRGVAHGWDWTLFARAENLTDKTYVASVIVNNSAPLEPGLPRNWLIGLRTRLAL